MAQREQYVGFSTVNKDEAPYDAGLWYVIEDARNVIDRDTRVALVSINAKELENVLRLEIELHFTPQDVVDNLFIEYDRRNKEAI